MSDEKKQSVRMAEWLPDDEMIQKLLKLMSNKARRMVVKVPDIPGHEDELLVIDVKWEKDVVDEAFMPISHILN